jgi:putative membrane protein
MPDVVNWLPAALTLVVLGGGYVTLGARRARGALPHWPRSRTAAWLCGVALLAAALSPPALAATYHDHTAHMLAHLTLGMYAPLALVLGAPLGLLLGDLPRHRALALTTGLRARPVQALAHPATAAVLHIGGLAALYLTPLYGLTLRSPVAQCLVLTHFVLAGTLFTWSIAAIGPGLHRSLRVRLIVLVAAAGVHAFLAKLLYARATEPALHHGGMAPNAATHAAAVSELEGAAQLMYYGGDGAEVLLAVVVLLGWYRRAGRRADIAPLSPAAGPALRAATPAPPGQGPART